MMDSDEAPRWGPRKEPNKGSKEGPRKVPNNDRRRGLQRIQESPRGGPSKGPMFWAQGLGFTPDPMAVGPTLDASKWLRENM